MTENEDNKKKKMRDLDDVLGFPFSRVMPSTSKSKFKNLGSGKMAKSLGVAKEQQSGHWCSQCKGIWFGYLLEVECPKCGNRQG